MQFEARRVSLSAGIIIVIPSDRPHGPYAIFLMVMYDSYRRGR